MTPRKRFGATLAHASVDRAPFDLAGTALTSVEPSAAEALLAQLQYAKRPLQPLQRLDERVLRLFDVDFRAVGDVLEPPSILQRTLSDTERVDAWGVHRVYTGMYWDIKTPPLRGADIADLDRYPWPRAEDIPQREIDELAARARYLYEETDRVVVAGHPVFGVMEMGCWMCGFDEFLLRMALDEPFVRRFFDIFYAYQRKVIERYYGALGRYIHATTSGDDFGTQNGPFLSPDMFARLVAPYMKDRIAYTKSYTGAAFFHHTCGGVFPLIPALIDAGVDILNPMQPGARDMEPQKLKSAFGDRLTFWGGMDTQHVLRTGSRRDVFDSVAALLDAMAEGGGFVFAPAHNIQPDIPPENIVAMYAAAAAYYE